MLKTISFQYINAQRSNSKYGGDNMSKKVPEKVKNTLRNGIPSQITFTEDGNKLIMTLSPKGIGLANGKSLNMQEDGAAFEGWALIIYSKNDYSEIVLDAEMNTGMDKLPDSRFEFGHYNRFLYRAMRFSEYYDWFSLSDIVLKAVNRFREIFYSGTKNLVNNIGTGNAGDNNKLENYIEGLLGGDEALAMEITGVSPLYRQLPVGLFEEPASNSTRIFTGGKSAIDLWGLSGNNLHIFELKTKNPKVGVLSELFFYACYAFDMYCDESPKFIKPKEPDNDDNRGYSVLFNNGKVESITAHILADELHARISENVNLLMNSMRMCKNKRINFADPIMFEKKLSIVRKK